MDIHDDLIICNNYFKHAVIELFILLQFSNVRYYIYKYINDKISLQLKTIPIT